MVVTVGRARALPKERRPMDTSQWKSVSQDYCNSGKRISRRVAPIPVTSERGKIALRIKEAREAAAEEREQQALAGLGALKSGRSRGSRSRSASSRPATSAKSTSSRGGSRSSSKAAHRGSSRPADRAGSGLEGSFAETARKSSAVYDGPVLLPMRRQVDMFTYGAKGDIRKTDRRRAHRRAQEATIRGEQELMALAYKSASYERLLAATLPPHASRMQVAAAAYHLRNYGSSASQLRKCRVEELCALLGHLPQDFALLDEDERQAVVESLYRPEEVPVVMDVLKSFSASGVEEAIANAAVAEAEGAVAPPGEVGEHGDMQGSSEEVGAGVAGSQQGAAKQQDGLDVDATASSQSARGGEDSSIDPHVSAVLERACWGEGADDVPTADGADVKMIGATFMSTEGANQLLSPGRMGRRTVKFAAGTDGEDEAYRQPQDVVALAGAVSDRAVTFRVQERAVQEDTIQGREMDDFMVVQALVSAEEARMRPEKPWKLEMYAREERVRSVQERLDKGIQRAVAEHAGVAVDGFNMKAQRMSVAGALNSGGNILRADGDMVDASLVKKESKQAIAASRKAEALERKMRREATKSQTKLASDNKQLKKDGVSQGSLMLTAPDGTKLAKDMAKEQADSAARQARKLSTRHGFADTDLLRAEVGQLLQRHCDEALGTPGLVAQATKEVGATGKLTTRISEEVRAVRQARRAEAELKAAALRCAPARVVDSMDLGSASTTMKRWAEDGTSHEEASSAASSHTGENLHPSVSSSSSACGAGAKEGSLEQGVGGSCAGAVGSGADGPDSGLDSEKSGVRQSSLLDNSADIGDDGGSIGGSDDVSGIGANGNGASSDAKGGDSFGGSSSGASSGTDGDSVTGEIVRLKRMFEQWLVDLGGDKGSFDGLDHAAHRGARGDKLAGGHGPYHPPSRDDGTLGKHYHVSELMKGPTREEQAKLKADARHSVQVILADARAKTVKRVDVLGACVEMEEMRARREKKVRKVMKAKRLAQQVVEESKERLFGKTGDDASRAKGKDGVTGDVDADGQFPALEDVDPGAFGDVLGGTSGKGGKGRSAGSMYKPDAFAGTRYDTRPRQKVRTEAQVAAQDKLARRLRYGAWYLPKGLWTDAVDETLPTGVTEDQIQRVLGHVVDDSDVTAASRRSAALHDLQMEQDARLVEEKLKRSYVTFVLRNFIEKSGKPVPEWMRDVKIDVSAGLPSFAIEVLAYEDEAAGGDTE